MTSNFITYSQTEHISHYSFTEGSEKYRSVNKYIVIYSDGSEESYYETNDYSEKVGTFSDDFGWGTYTQVTDTINLCYEIQLKILNSGVLRDTLRAKAEGIIFFNPFSSSPNIKYCNCFIILSLVLNIFGRSLLYSSITCSF